MTTETRDEIAPNRAPNVLVRWLPTVARILMGLMLCASGAFGLLTAFGAVTSPPAAMPAGATAFAGALAKTGYMMPLVSGVQLLVGVLLLINRFVPLALVLLAPLLVNILAFHMFLSPEGAVPGVVFSALELYLAWVYRAAYRPLLTARANFA